MNRNVHASVVRELSAAVASVREELARTGYRLSLESVEADGTVHAELAAGEGACGECLPSEVLVEILEEHLRRVQPDVSVNLLVR